MYSPVNISLWASYNLNCFWYCKGETIVPFITHGGGGKYTIAEDMGKLAKGATVLNPLVIYERGDSNTDKEIENWLKEIK